MWIYFTLFFCSLAAGVINAIAGGGTILTFPALLTVLSPISANATSTLALLPGTLASAAGFRRELRGSGRLIAELSVTSFLGGIVGALLLTCLPDRIFKEMVPWLLLLAALLFSLRPLLLKLRRSAVHASAKNRESRYTLFLIQFAIGIYGGYFGAAMGIITLAAYSLWGMTDIHRMNGIKAVVTACANAIAALIFIYQGVIHWEYAALMAIGAACGGYAGARIAKRLDPRAVQILIAVISFGLSFYFFVK